MMEEEKTKKIENEKSPETGQPKEDIHYHYHMDESGPQRNKEGYPYKEQKEATPQKKPGEVHYHYYYEPPRMRKKKSSKPTIAGALLLIHAILAILLGTILVFAGSFVGELGGGIEFFGEDGKGDIIGTVTLLDGTPVENATISIVDEGLSTRTDSEGNYLLYSVPTGNQKIKVEKEGYNTIIHKTFIKSSDINNERDRQDEDDDFDNRYDFILTEGDEVIERGSYPPFGLIRNVLYICAILLIVLSIFTILGGISALMRKNYWLAILGSITGIITLGLFALIALFILILAKDEFRKTENANLPRGPNGGPNFR